MTTKFGWCLDGHHKQCPGHVVGLEPGGPACSCPCHQKKSED